MEMIKCRTCLKLSNKYECINIQAGCSSEQSVKQVILHLVPEMIISLNDDDMICAQCFRTLRLCVKFIKTCLTVVETILADDKSSFSSIVKEETDLSDDEFKAEPEQIENIIIEVDSDHNYYLKEVKTDGGNASSIDDFNEGSNCNTNDSEQFALDSSLPNNDKLHRSNNNLGSPLTIILENSDSPFQTNLPENVELEYSTSGINLETAVKEEDDAITCSICSAIFSKVEDYAQHMETHISLCQYCGKSFFDQNIYNTHMLQHKETLLKVCEFCGKTLKGARSLKMHIAAMHEESSPHICDKCPKSFKHKYKVNLHVKEVHEKSRQQQCSVCGKLFANLDRCKTHYRLVHLKLKPYTCTICGTKFGRKDYLDKHRTELHMNDRKKDGSKQKRIPKHGVRLRNPGKPVFCRVCGKEIASVHLLKAHLENHVKIKRYKCKYCDLTFSVNNNKKRHEKLHESDSENKFRCNICWKRVRTEEELEQHVINHNRPPQYSCETCGEKFHRRYLLKNHIAEKHTSLEDIQKAVEEIVIKNLLEYADPSCN